MSRRVALAIALQILAIACLSAGMGPPARAADKISCDAFARLGDGSWQALSTTLIPDRNFRVQEGSLWRPGATVMGVDVAAMLETECPNAPVGLPQPAAATAAPAAPGQPQQPLAPQVPQMPQVPLSRYADANGNIDVRSLTCVHLNDASAAEADTLLAWYSGWYGAQEKKRMINPSQVRYAVRNVIEYCKANGDKSLVKVMELMLK
jgi:hypothetical protein